MTSASTLRVALTGASGTIGSILAPALVAAGHTVTPIVRKDPGPGEIRWDPAGRGLDPAALRNIDAVIHLAGENIAEGRWTQARKKEILESRKQGTRLLVDAITKADPGPRTLVSASAIGYYGERGEEELTEQSAPGTGFLPEVCLAWESATDPASRAGVRVVRIRTGLLLSSLLQRMRLPFQLGIGGCLGDGKQWMSWIATDDLIAIYRYAVETTLSGPANAVAPGAVRNEEFTRVLAKTLHRPGMLPVPKSALRLLFGQMADEAILASTRVSPAALTNAGFRFQLPSLDTALARELEAVR